MAKSPAKKPGAARSAAGNIGGAIPPPLASDNAGAVTEPDKVRPLRTPKTEFEYGRMKVRIFHCQEADLDELGRLSRDTTVLAAISTGFGGFALDVTKDLFLAGTANAEKTAFFAGVSVVCWFVASLAGIGAALKWKGRHDKLGEIKRKVTFDADLKPVDKRH